MTGLPGPQGGITPAAGKQNIGSGDDLTEGTRAVYAEASANPDDQAAVAHTLVGRTKAPGFPDNIVDVVYQKVPNSDHYQFESVEIYMTTGKGKFADAANPSALSKAELKVYISARETSRAVMAGTRPIPSQLSGTPLFFESFPTKPGGWWGTLNYLGQIGAQRYYNNAF